MKYEEYKHALELPLKEKLWQSTLLIRARVRQYYPKIYVAWSGGKDSTVVLYLARQEEPNIPVIFNNTGVEHPETINFIRRMTEEWKLNLIETKPVKSFWQCVKEYGFPNLRAYAKESKRKGSSTPKCCIYLKERPFFNVIREHKFEAYFTGITTDESMQRRLLILRYGFCYISKNNTPYHVRRIHPIWNWTEQNVWNFIRDNNIPYNKIYDLGAPRCGCLPCTGYLSWREQMNLLAPKLYERVSLQKDGQTLISSFESKKGCQSEGGN